MKSSIIIVSIFCAASIFAAPPHSNGVVLPVSAASQLLIPVAGSTPGANGTFFRSEITLVNFASHDQQVQLQWLPQGGGSTPTKTVTIPAQNGTRSSDFVATVLGQSGLGAIIVSGVTSTGAVDPTALLWASSRIWTNEPGTSGTTSQSLPAIPLNGLFSGTTAGLFSVGGADNPANYRVNVGVVNLTATSQTYAVTQQGGTTNFVIVPAMSMAQVSVATGTSSTQQILIQNVTGGTVAPNSWIAYGSTVDNVTGDAWSELAVPGQ
ncbi:MAG TPA: hypothetical protein VJ853_14320 [Thermoanaerobaculia bacterium]|nr:hypothetical protein [Thermoanaerobaculia bacterium]